MKNLARQLETACAQALCTTAAQGAALARQMAPVQSGALRASIHVQEHGMQAAVIAGASHAAPVEYGTSRMAARPFMLPMAREMRGTLMRNVRAAVREVIR